MKRCPDITVSRCRSVVTGARSQEQGDTLLLNGGNGRVPTRGHWRTGGGDWRWYPDIKGLIFTSLGFVDLYVAIIHLFIYLWWWHS